jgi:PBP1b-binding outer membrane lipoprotein LpoB
MKSTILLICAAILLLAACYSPTANLYQSEKTPGVDFKNYKTYAWLPTKDTAYTKLANKKTVESALALAVSQQLDNRGMKFDSLTPDCLFTYSLVLSKTYELGQEPPPVYAPNSNAGALPGQYNMYYYVPASTASYNPDLYQGSMKVTTFRDGTLVLDMIDRKTNQIVWRTNAQGKVNEKDRQGIRPTINEIVPVMFKKFPISK